MTLQLSHANKNYDNVTLASVTESTIKMDYNPSYGIIDKYGNAVKMDSNPSYDVTDLSCDAAKLKRKTSEDQVMWSISNN